MKISFIFTGTILILSMSLIFITFDEGTTASQNQPIDLKQPKSLTTSSNNIKLLIDQPQRRDNHGRKLPRTKGKKPEKEKSSRSASPKPKSKKKSNSRSRSRTPKKSDSPKVTVKSTPKRRGSASAAQVSKKSKSRSSARRVAPVPIIVPLTKKQKLAALKADHLSAVVDSVIVFNVGQGNGILVTTASAMWIVDFGSSGPPTGLTANVFTSKKAVDEVRAILSDATHVLKPIIILVTHPDKDHYNLIPNIFNSDLLKIRIKYWIYPNKHDVKDFKIKKPALKLLGIVNKRLNVSREFVYNQDPTQTIIFMNAPFKNDVSTNGNSLMLRIKLPRTVIVLTGDATHYTFDQAKNIYPDEYYARTRFVFSAQQKLYNKTWWDNINYVVGPHHGACTEDSHLVAGLLKPKNGIIFSAPMYSQFGHPSLASIAKAAQTLKVELGDVVNKKFLEKDKFVFWDNGTSNAECLKELYKPSYETANLKNSLAEISITKVYSYGYGAMDAFINKIQVKSTVALPDVKKVMAAVFYSAHDFNIGKTRLPIYITGVDGNITIKDLPADVPVVPLVLGAQAPPIVYNKNVTYEYSPDPTDLDALKVILNSHLEAGKEKSGNKNITMRLPQVVGLINENPA